MEFRDQSSPEHEKKKQIKHSAYPRVTFHIRGRGPTQNIKRAVSCKKEKKVAISSAQRSFSKKKEIQLALNISETKWNSCVQKSNVTMISATILYLNPLLQPAGFNEVFSSSCPLKAGLHEGPGLLREVFEMYNTG